MQRLGHAAEVVARLARVAPLARRQHHHAQASRVGREDGPPRVRGHRHRAGAPVEHQPEARPDPGAVAQHVEHRERAAAPRGGGQRVHDAPDARVGEHLERLLPLRVVGGAGVAQRRLVARRRHGSGRGRPGQQDPPALGPRVRRLVRGRGLGSLVPQQHPRQRAQVLAATRQGQQLPRQRVELGRGRAEGDHHAPARVMGRGDRARPLRPRRTLEEARQRLAHALDHRRIAVGSAQGLEVAQQRGAPVDLEQLAAPALGPQGVRLRLEAERVRILRRMGARELEVEEQVRRIRHGGRDDKVCASSLTSHGVVSPHRSAHAPTGNAGSSGVLPLG